MSLRTLSDFNGPAAALMRPTDHARRALRVAGLLLGAFAVVVAVAVGLSATLTQSAGSLHPLVAGLTTLLVCWVLLGLGAAWWDRRLAALDRQSWATGWARVEPVWSNRR